MYLATVSSRLQAELPFPVGKFALLAKFLHFCGR